MTTSEITSLVGHFGFPIFVAVWLMIRTDRFIQENSKVTQELVILLRGLQERK